LQLAVDGVYGPTQLVYVKSQLVNVAALGLTVASRLTCLRKITELSPQVI
jgi:hypothetical protein